MPTVITMTGHFGEPERVIKLERPMTVAEVISQHELEFRLPTIAVMDGQPVMRGEWDTRVIGSDEAILFASIPGGGGNSSPKQVVGLIAGLALSIAAPMIGGAVAGAMFSGSVVASSIVSGLVLAPSSYIILDIGARP